MSHHLLTGATGLLGAYLLRDLMAKEISLVVIARSNRQQSARARIDDIITRWERGLGYALPRPVVMEGDLTKPDLGLQSDQLDWIRANCSSVIHNAASLRFVGQDKEGEPWQSNLNGTQHVLDVCQKTNIEAFFHVSTAYVCGQRTGDIKETDVDVGQEPSNDYEASKLQAELLVRGADWLRSKTFLRPSIISGDSQTGFSSTFHGFYFPLKAACFLLGSVQLDSENNQADALLKSMGLTGEERKNVVPVDWVSESMSRIIADPELHNETYHLTTDFPLRLKEMTKSMLASLEEVADSVSKDAQPKPAASQKLTPEEFQRQFQNQMTAYQSYWRDDPSFNSDGLKAVGISACPQVDDVLMRRWCRFALQNRFQVPPLQVPSQDIFESRQEPCELSGTPTNTNLCITGRAGGSWTFQADDTGITSVIVGRNELANVPTVHMNSRTWRDLRRGELSPGDAVKTGSAYVESNQTNEIRLVELIARGNYEFV